jgi:hypothetical protein
MSRTPADQELQADPCDAGASSEQAAASPEPPENQDGADTPNELEEGFRFVSRQLTRQALEQAHQEATLRALVETLVEAGALPPGRFEQRRQRRLDEAARDLADRPVVRLAQAVDKYALGPLPDVPCAELLPLCKAACCRFSVTLSPQDLDEGGLHWDYAEPYVLRRGPSGHCVHSEPDTHRCTQYGRRPAICRQYDCRKDRRVWRDFERRILADSDEE